jgi:hypothetical protein
MTARAYPPGPPWQRELADRGVLAVALALGAEERPGRSVAPCPACGADRRGSADPRGPVGTTRDGRGWRCHRCGAGGDGATWAALAVTGHPSPGERWDEVRRALELGDSAGWRALAPRPPPPKPPEYPPAADVTAIWAAARGVTYDDEVSALLARRGLDPLLAEDLDLGRALSRDAQLPPWASYRGRPWTACGYRLVVPGYDARGAMRNLRAWRVTPAKDDSPKRIVCRRAAGLVLADGLARQVLAAGAAPEWWADRPLELVITEGEPDYLTWAMRYGSSAGLERAPAVIGVCSGSWSPELAARIPDGARVSIRTHRDDAGNKYAASISATLVRRTTCTR